MRLAVFSDVHGNLEALAAFLKHSRDRCVDRYACVGDIIGYGPNPNECITEISSIPQIITVKGNHEWACSDPTKLSVDMVPMAYKSIVWTQKRLNPHSMKYIAQIDHRVETLECTFVHASAHQPTKWEYLNFGKTHEIMLCFEYSSTRITFVGHTHRPMILDSYGRFLTDDINFPDGTTYADDGVRRILVNPGSIGQPRDTLRKPCYVLHDTITNELTWYRLNNYDPEITAQKILATDLPAECAYYLTRSGTLA